MIYFFTLEDLSNEILSEMLEEALVGAPQGCEFFLANKETPLPKAFSGIVSSTKRGGGERDS